MAVALILVTIGVVNASLQTTNILRSWDDSLARYENGNLTMYLDGQPQPFYTKLDFSSANPADLHPDACGAGTSTYWAGDAVIGLYHTDNAPAGAQGFQSSSKWSIVKCTALANNTKFVPAADVIATCTGPGNPEDGPCVLIGAADQIVACTTGNCSDEIETRFHINTDLACDGTMDEPYATEWANGNLCLYWEAEKPANIQPVWGGNIQVRYGTGVGGDKTINFNQLRGPNAVSMSSIAATAEANSGTLAAWAGAMLLAAVALFLWRRQSSV
jgi:hypothetical protein